MISVVMCPLFRQTRNMIRQLQRLRLLVLSIVSVKDLVAYLQSTVLTTNFSVGMYLYANSLTVRSDIRMCFRKYAIHRNVTG